MSYSSVSSAEKKNLTISILMNLAVSALSAVGTSIIFARSGFGMLEMYTVDSNILAMLSCLVYAVFLIRKLKRGKDVPAWALMAKYASVCCLTVTFLVVVAVLAPMFGPEGYQMMLLRGDMLYHHLFCPILAVLSFFLFDRVPAAPGKAAGIALMPTLAYAAVTVALNLARIIDGPYPFLKVYEQPVWMSFVWVLLIIGGAYAIAFLLAKLRSQA